MKRQPITTFMRLKLRHQLRNKILLRNQNRSFTTRGISTIQNPQHIRFDNEAILDILVGYYVRL